MRERHLEAALGVVGPLAPRHVAGPGGDQLVRKEAALREHRPQVGAEHREHQRLHLRRQLGGGRQRGAREVRLAEQRDRLGEGLRVEPGERVFAVVDLVHQRAPLPFALPLPAHVLQHAAQAVAHEHAAGEGEEDVARIGVAHQHDGRALEPFGHQHVGLELHPVAHHHVEVAPAAFAVGVVGQAVARAHDVLRQRAGGAGEQSEQEPLHSKRGT